MSKKYIKILCLVFLMLININVYALEDTANSEHYYSKEVNGNKLLIDDTANLLNKDEIELLAKKMEDLTKFGNIAFKSTATNGQNTKDFARNYYRNNFGTSSGSVFVIDMNNRYIYIFSDGMNYKLINKSKALTITDNVYKYATNEDYYTCAYEAFDQMEAVLLKEKVPEPMRYISGFIVALILSCFICYIKVYFNSNNYAASNEDILKNCDIKYDIKSVSSRQTGQESEYSPVDTGGDFGGSGGGFGGGGSGGGGGHSF